MTIALMTLSIIAVKIANFLFDMISVIMPGVAKAIVIMSVKFFMLVGYFMLSWHPILPISLCSN
jgi:hypothetical protein